MLLIRNDLSDSPIDSILILESNSSNDYMFFKCIVSQYLNGFLFRKNVCSFSNNTRIILSLSKNY